MCGILYAKRKDGKDVGKTINKRYKKQSLRGTQGFGFVSLDNSGNILRVERSMTEKEILERLQSGMADSMLFHHRYPTSTANIPSATHPILVSDMSLKYDYYVIHNGVISNPTALKADHTRLGYEYTTEIKKRTVYTQKDGEEFYIEGLSEFNDSESLAIELALYFEGYRDDMTRVCGSIAFIALRATKDGQVDRVYYGHNDGNPLVLEESNEVFCLKSEGHGVDVPVDTLFWFDVKDHVINSKALEIGTYARKLKAGFAKNDYPASIDWRDKGYGTSHDRTYEEIDEAISEAIATEADSDIEGLEYEIFSLEEEIEEVNKQIEKNIREGKEIWLQQEELKELLEEKRKKENDIAMIRIDQAYGW